MKIEPIQVQEAFRRSLNEKLSLSRAQSVAKSIESRSFNEAIEKIRSDTGQNDSLIFNVLLGISERDHPSCHVLVDALSEWTNSQHDVAWISKSAGRLISSKTFMSLVSRVSRRLTIALASQKEDVTYEAEEDLSILVEGSNDQRMAAAIVAVISYMHYIGEDSDFNVIYPDLLEKIREAWKTRNIDLWISQVATLPPLESLIFEKVIAQAIVSFVLNFNETNLKRISYFPSARTVAFDYDKNHHDFEINHNFSQEFGRQWRQTNSNVNLAYSSHPGKEMASLFWVRTTDDVYDEDLLLLGDSYTLNSYENSKDSMASIWIIGAGPHSDAVHPIFSMKIVRNAKYIESHQVTIEMSQNHPIKGDMYYYARESLAMVVMHQLYEDMKLRVKNEKTDIALILTDENGRIRDDIEIHRQILSFFEFFSGPISDNDCNIGYFDGERFDYGSSIDESKEQKKGQQ